MNDKMISALAIVLSLALSGGVEAQQVYYCEQADGSVVFSDLPCESDIGREDQIDATPHQGHRPPPEQPAYQMPDTAQDSARTQKRTSRVHPATTRQEAPPLSRKERLVLERERKALLSELKRRHISPKRRRAMIADLRKADSKLGLGPEDVADMPPHDRDVYQDHAVYPGEFRLIRFKGDDRGGQ